MSDRLADRQGSRGGGDGRENVMTTFARLEPGDLDLIVGTLKEFTDRNTPLGQRMHWDETDTCPADVVRAMLGPEV
jgi:hypothetical protein